MASPELAFEARALTVELDHAPALLVEQRGGAIPGRTDALGLGGVAGALLAAALGSARGAGSLDAELGFGHAGLGGGERRVECRDRRVERLDAPARVGDAVVDVPERGGAPRRECSGCAVEVAQLAVQAAPAAAELVPAVVVDARAVDAARAGRSRGSPSVLVRPHTGQCYPSRAAIRGIDGDDARSREVPPRRRAAALQAARPRRCGG